MPATRSRSSTEQSAEVAEQPEVKQPASEETESVVAPIETVKEAEAVEAAVAEEAAPEADEEEKPVEAEAVVAPANGEAAPAEATPVVAENGSAEKVVDAKVVEGEEAVGEKRKSVDGGEGDAPDSTDVVVKKAKVDEEAPVEPSVETPAV